MLFHKDGVKYWSSHFSSRLKKLKKSKKDTITDQIGEDLHHIQHTLTPILDDCITNVKENPHQFSAIKDHLVQKGAHIEGFEQKASAQLDSASLSLAPYFVFFKESLDAYQKTLNGKSQQEQLVSQDRIALLKSVQNVAHSLALLHDKSNQVSADIQQTMSNVYGTKKFTQTLKKEVLSGDDAHKDAFLSWFK